MVGAGHHGRVPSDVPPRLVNSALLVLVAIALLTGTVAFALGTAAAGRPVVLAHAATGLALLVIAPAKSRIVRRGLHHALGTDDPAAMPVTQWFTDVVPEGSLPAAVAVVDARGARRVAVSDIDAAGDTVRATLDCTGGWYATQNWRGAWLGRIVQPHPDDRSVIVTSATGYQRRLPVEQLPGLLLATQVAEAPLSRGHGSPVRLVAPGRRGFWWVKWITEVRTDPAPAWQQPPFPLT